MRLVRFATFNIRYDTPADGARSWSNRKRRVRLAIRDLRPTVIGIQEARPNQYADLQNWFSEYSWLGTCRQGDGTGEHIVLGFDKRYCYCRDSGGFWLSETPGSPSVGWDGARPRVATWADLKIGEHVITIINTHLDHAGEQARQNGAKLLCQYLESQQNPTILLGDLNATPSDPTLEWLRDNKHECARERARIVEGSGHTFHGFGDGPHERIDYLLPSQKYPVFRAGTVDTEPPFPSDHNPVFADINIPRA